MTNERALEIIAAHGAEVARWPDAERAAAMALTGSDAAVAAAFAEARRLDALLNGWARDVPVRTFDAAAIIAAAPAVAAPALLPARLPRPMARWLAGGAVAAALLGVAVVGSALRMAPVPADPAAPAIVAVAAPAAASAAPPVVLAAVDLRAGEKVSSNTGLAGNAATRLAVADGGALGSDAEVFAHVFTPTVYEDELI